MHRYSDAPFFCQIPCLCPTQYGPSQAAALGNRWGNNADMEVAALAFPPESWPAGGAPCAAAGFCGDMGL